MTYRTLDADMIQGTIERLQKRIEERFPGRGLGRLCGELLTIAREDRERLSWRRKPNLMLRTGVAAVVAAGAATVGFLSLRIAGMKVGGDAFGALQGIDSLVNLVALGGAAIWFLLNLEARMQREAVLRDLHELRSIAHVVDMHQLTKDPTISADSHAPTPSSPADRMSEFDLMRYLDYCSEMLSLTGKLAALYMQGVQDAVIIQAVNEIEDLTGNLSRKVWQKVMIIRQRAPGNEA